MTDLLRAGQVAVCYPNDTRVDLTPRGTRQRPERWALQWWVFAAASLAASIWIARKGGKAKPNRDPS